MFSEFLFGFSADKIFNPKIYILFYLNKNMFSEINLLAVLGVSVLSFIIGWLWYSPFLFGNQWIKLSGITPKMAAEMKKKEQANLTL